jgi:hypothetical protein
MSRFPRSPVDWAVIGFLLACLTVVVWAMIAGPADAHLGDRTYADWLGEQTGVPAWIDVDSLPPGPVSQWAVENRWELQAVRARCDTLETVYWQLRKRVLALEAAEAARNTHHNGR